MRLFGRVSRRWTKFYVDGWTSKGQGRAARRAMHSVDQARTRGSNCPDGQFHARSRARHAPAHLMGPRSGPAHAAGEDIAATKAALLAKGVTPNVDITDVAPLGIKVMFVNDPEGNPSRSSKCGRMSAGGDRSSPSREVARAAGADGGVSPLDSAKPLRQPLRGCTSVAGEDLNLPLAGYASHYNTVSRELAGSARGFGMLSILPAREVASAASS